MWWLESNIQLTFSWGRISRVHLLMSEEWGGLPVRCDWGPCGLWIATLKAKYRRQIWAQRQEGVRKEGRGKHRDCITIKQEVWQQRFHQKKWWLSFFFSSPWSFLCVLLGITELRKCTWLLPAVSDSSVGQMWRCFFFFFKSTHLY